MKIVKRADWKARPAVSVHPLPAHVNWFAHWEGTDYPEQMTHAQAMQSIQRFHQVTRGWSDIAYHFVIFPDGAVYEGRGFGVEGAATQGRNLDSMAFCFAWGPDGGATPAALRAAHELMELGRKEHGLAPLLHPHSDARPTQCPGDELRDWAHNYTHDEQGDTDMIDAPTLTNAQFVDDCYVRILGRSPDAEGYTFWNGKLDRGEMSRGDLRFEFYLVQRAAAEAAFQALAVRPGTSPDLAAFVKAAESKFYSDLAALASEAARS